ncbi:MAG TPA: glycosyltransferase [Chloroflexota bacterium]|nr:glycosyltransferase [Chloroflexota bacterium]
MRILTVTNMFPTERNPQFGIFIQEQVESIRQLGLEVDVLFVNGREGRLRQKGYLVGFPALWRALRSCRYDVIHAHYIFSGIIARAQWAAPLVLTHHGVEVRDRFQGGLCRLTRFWPDEQIVVADWMIAPLRSPRAHVIPCGIDLDLFRPMPKADARAQLGLEPEKRYVLFAGYTWDPVKRFHLVEQAVRILKSRLPDVELVAVCQQPHQRIPLYMNACDVFAMTSSFEGSAQVVKEAMACNLPIVATDAGDNWDVLGDTAGCYRTGDDPKEIAGHLEAAVSPPLRTDGRKQVERFGLRSTAERVVSVYEAALRAGPASQRTQSKNLKAEVL